MHAPSTIERRERARIEGAFRRAEDAAYLMIRLMEKKMTKRQPIPAKLPEGQYLYIVVGSGPKRKYLHSIQPIQRKCEVPKINLAPTKALAKAFNLPELARDYCRFLHRLPIDVDFELVMEAS